MVYAASRAVMADKIENGLKLAARQTFRPQRIKESAACCRHVARPDASLDETASTVTYVMVVAIYASVREEQATKERRPAGADIEIADTPAAYREDVARCQRRH